MPWENSNRPTYTFMGKYLEKSPISWSRRYATRNWRSSQIAYVDPSKQPLVNTTTAVVTIKYPPDRIPNHGDPLQDWPIFVRSGVAIGSFAVRDDVSLTQALRYKFDDDGYTRHRQGDHPGSRGPNFGFYQSNAGLDIVTLDSVAIDRLNTPSSAFLSAVGEIPRIRVDGLLILATVTDGEQGRWNDCVTESDAASRADALAHFAERFRLDGLVIDAQAPDTIATQAALPMVIRMLRERAPKLTLCMQLYPGSEGYFKLAYGMLSTAISYAWPSASGEDPAKVLPRYRSAGFDNMQLVVAFAPTLPLADAQKQASSCRGTYAGAYVAGIDELENGKRLGDILTALGSGSKWTIVDTVPPVPEEWLRYPEPK